MGSSNTAVSVQKRKALQTEFDELNHMLTHQPPSAWAKREKKYHDDKKAWDSQAADLKRKMKRLQDEVQVLKDNNRAVVLQEQVQVHASFIANGPRECCANATHGSGASALMLHGFCRTWRPCSMLQGKSVQRPEVHLRKLHLPLKSWRKTTQNSRRPMMNR